MSEPLALPQLAVRQMDWLRRRFDHELAPEQFPAVLDRFRGTIARLEAFTPPADPLRTAKPDGKWSIQEHVGHLIDLEQLGERRLADFGAKADALIAADMSNQQTEQAQHNLATWWDLCRGFRLRREALVSQLEALPADVIAHKAFHPRLKRHMNVPEWVFFMCEHDDHHLARMRELSVALMLSVASE